MAGAGSGTTSGPIFLPPVTATPPTALPPRVISSSAPVPGISSTLDLKEEQKRWLVIGICLNKILLPTLRDFIKSAMLKHYTNLKSNHNIETQTYSKHLKKDKYDLNYGSINNNEAHHGKKANRYDYQVKSEVDLAKLYLLPYMAKFSGFDDTCDLSAVLGILSSASIFSPAVQGSSKDVRKDVRNEWGHCNFVDWTKLKFLTSFKQMDSLVRNLRLIPAEEKRVTDELADWENKGVQLCTGNMVDADLIKFVRQEVTKLLGDVKRLDGAYQGDLQRISETLDNVKKEIEEYQDKLKISLDSLQLDQKGTSQKVEQLSDVTEALSHDVGSIKTSQSKLETKVADVAQNQKALAKRIDEGETKYENLDNRVEALESAIETRSNDRAINIFQAPYRIPCFHGRVQELLILAGQLKEIKSPCKVTAVCGLGGTGKTSLAIEHIWQKKEAYSGGVFWISGESNNLFNLSVSEMARQIGTFSDEDFKTTLSKTLDWLQSRQDTWCLVIDNLDELELSTEMLKLLGGHWKRQACGHILITTRRQKKTLTEDIPDLIEDSCIELKNLSESEGVEFMKKRTERPGDADDIVIAKLVVELGCLPLALDQAAAYIKNRKEISFSDYLEQYKEQKLKTLKRSKAHYPVQDTSKDRIAVHTTWQLNFDYVSLLSKEYGIGKAAALVMEVSAFLSPDDIPNDVLNQGLPLVDNEDLLNCVSTTLGKTDILDVLTKFSLFQTFTEKSFSVHRLVQEVIRDKVNEDNRLKEVLQCASRMLYYAFDNNRSPVEVCQSFQGDSVFNQENPPSLYLWGKLGAHASVLLTHLIQSSQMSDEFRQQILYSEESVMLLNEVSVYLNVCRQTKEALELKESKLKVLTGLNLEEAKVNYINFFDIPLKDFEFKLISHCMAAHESAANEEREREAEAARKRREADRLRQKGNEAVKSKKYKEAGDFYTAAIECIKDDPRLHNNRAVCELKLQNPEAALRDCESCLNLEERNTKALMRKAWALYELSKTDNQEQNLEGRMKAAAALAVHYDSTLLNDKHFKRMFPKVEFKEIFNSSELAASFMYIVPGMTYLLHDGYYDFHGAMLDVDMQLVALTSQKVTLKFVNLGLFQSNLYVEGLIFAKGNGSIVCQQNGSLDFFKCKISGGLNCCKDYPDCNGGSGCIAAELEGEKACDRTGNYGKSVVSGIVGTSSILIVQGSNCNVENCDVTECGGMAMICQDKGSVLRVASSRVYGNPQSGLMVSNGARLVATNSEFYANGFHGILISIASGACQISNNRIYENKKDAVSVNGTEEKVEIKNNRIYHNFGLGIGLLNCSQVEVSRNEIFENSYYGIGVKLSTTAVIEKNDIYSNKCGGVYIESNYAGRILIDSNTVRDHNGSWLVNQNMPYNFHEQKIDPKPNRKCYAIAPILCNNKLQNNEECMIHPKERMKSVQNECAFCRQSKNLSKCSRCNIASYCNRKCQEKHWSKHKALCSALSDQYSLTIELMVSSKHSTQPERNPESTLQLQFMMFGSHLKGIGEGPKPDPKRNQRFIVKVQTEHHNCHPLQILTAYDKSYSVYSEFQSPEIFNIVMECGVLGKFCHFTSKKAFFDAVFVDGGKKLKIYLGKLAPYQEW